jgi:hypothetical protein
MRWLGVFALCCAALDAAPTPTGTRRSFAILAAHVFAQESLGFNAKILSIDVQRNSHEIAISLGDKGNSFYTQ